MKAEQPHLDLNLGEPITCRSVWISDIHLGTRHARVAELLDFLRVVDCKYLYIVGDFIDGWELKFRWYWRDDYNVLIQKLLRKSRKQTKVIYISGNHDEFIEQFMGTRFGNVTIARQAIHTAADGKKYLVIHGHQADGLTHFNHLLEKLGSHLYNWILDFNLYFNRVRRRMGFGYWSVAAYLKSKAKSAVKYITEYEDTLAADGAQADRRRRHLRPHPPRCVEDDRRRGISELRRLGGKLHRAGGRF